MKYSFCLLFSPKFVHEALHVAMECFYFHLFLQMSVIDVMIMDEISSLINRTILIIYPIRRCIELSVTVWILKYTRVFKSLTKLVVPHFLFIGEVVIGEVVVVCVIKVACNNL